MSTKSTNIMLGPVPIFYVPLIEQTVCKCVNINFDPSTKYG